MEAVERVMAEMVAIIPMPTMVAIGIIEEAVVAPIAVVERTVVVVVIAVVVAGADTDRDAITMPASIIRTSAEQNS
jgi:hypothetical protein